MKLLRAALTETVNVWPGMPEHTRDLPTLECRLEEIRAANVAHHLGLVARASALGVRVICFGELFPGPYFALHHDPFWTGLAEDAVNGRTVRTLCEAARAHTMVIVAPIYELDARSGRRYNTAVVIESNGTVLGRYRKMHIPHGSNEMGSFLEAFYYDRSNGENESTGANISQDPFLPVFETSVGRIGVAICYDRHFAGVMWTLARNGAQLVFSPAVTFGAKSERMWPMEFAVDAARHNIFIGGSNRRGSEKPWNQEFFGKSHFAGPNGTLENLSDFSELIVSDVDLDALSAPDPSGWNLQRDLRHGVVNLP